MGKGSIKAAKIGMSQAAERKAGADRLTNRMRETALGESATAQLAVLGQAVATVTHELRNPLAAVRTWVHVLEQRIPAEEAKFKRPLDRIKSGIARCDTIIDDLLDFARDRKADSEPTQLEEWLQTLIDDQFLPDGITIAFAPGLADPRVAIDRERMRRAVINLIENAVHSIESAESGGGKIAITTQQAGRNVEIRVSDNGPGVPPELREAIFEPLFSTKESGTGLGLPVVSRVAEQHDGTVRCEDVPGGGACFVISLPAGKHTPEAA